MNILLANKFFYLNGGSERVFFQERDFLLRNGIKVIDFSMEDPRNFYSPYSSFFISQIDYKNSSGLINNVKSGANFIHSSESVKKIKKLITKEKPHIAHLHNIYHQITPAIIPVLHEYGVKIILTLHDGKLICPSYLMLDKGNICTSCAGRYFWRSMTRNCQGSYMRGALFMLEGFWHKWKRSYQLVDLFIAPSQFLADLTRLRIPENKIIILHNGINTDAPPPHPQDAGYALYFGRLSREKGVETLLKAHHLLSNGIELKIVGTGPLEDKLRSKFPSVEFLGHLEGDALNNAIVHSSFAIVPSEVNENCSMVILEAMAMGKPVIGSRIGGIPEQIEDGETGLLFEMGNAKDLASKIQFLMKNHPTRIDMGKAARKKLEAEYSLTDHCRNLLKAYENILK